MGEIDTSDALIDALEGLRW